MSRTRIIILSVCMLNASACLEWLCCCGGEDSPQTVQSDTNAVDSYQILVEKLAEIRSLNFTEIMPEEVQEGIRKIKELDHIASDDYRNGKSVPKSLFGVLYEKLHEAYAALAIEQRIDAVLELDTSTASKEELDGVLAKIEELTPMVSEQRVSQALYDKVHAMFQNEREIRDKLQELQSRPSDNQGSNPQGERLQNIQTTPGTGARSQVD